MDVAPRKIIHVDMDAFFASVEQRDDPALRGRPVAVGHAASRGVVAAASYEARRFGVRSAMPSSTALRKCPELIFTPPRFEVYRAVSAQIHAIFADYTSLIEPLSLDEAYLDVTANIRGLPTASATAEEIRARILEETGLTASAGISYNKFLAKLASDQRKPNGQFVVPPGRGESFVEALPVKRFHGVGPVTAEKMNRLASRCTTTSSSGLRATLPRSSNRVCCLADIATGADLSTSIVPHQTISRIVGFAAGQADLMPVGWSSGDLYRRLREINERTFLACYPQAEIEAGSSEPDIPGDAADFTKLVRALGEYEYNSDLSGEGQLAALLASLMSRDDG